MEEKKIWLEKAHEAFKTYKKEAGSYSILLQHGISIGLIIPSKYKGIATEQINESEFFKVTLIEK